MLIVIRFCESLYLRVYIRGDMQCEDIMTESEKNSKGNDSLNRTPHAGAASSSPTSHLSFKPHNF